MIRDAAYWISLAHLQGWGFSAINRLIVAFYHERKISAEEFFSYDKKMWREIYSLTPKETEDLQKAKEQLPNAGFLAEQLQNNGIEVIPIVSPDYSSKIKSNLKTAGSPPVLYIKGNSQILKEDSVAIVGSRNASDISIEFTDNIARKSTEQFRVIVSGFAKGVDKAALDSALKYNGRSIIVLPQGIDTFSSGYKKYYKQIVEGDVLVLSAFHPKSVWSVGLAMARNPIIYGLADEIYVAESGDTGGTWAGVSDGLKKGRKIFVRRPSEGEKNANSLLIDKGAIPVDLVGNQLPTDFITEIDEVTSAQIMEFISLKPMKISEILEAVNGRISEANLMQFLKKQANVKEIRVRNIPQFTIIPPGLFGL